MKEIELYDETNTLDGLVCRKPYGALYQEFFNKQENLDLLEKNAFYNLYVNWSKEIHKIAGLLTAFLIKCDIDFIPYILLFANKSITKSITNGSINSLFIAFSPTIHVKNIIFPNEFIFSHINKNFWIDNFVISNDYKMTVNFNTSFEDAKKQINSNIISESDKINTLDDFYLYFNFLSDTGDLYRIKQLIEFNFLKG